MGMNVEEVVAELDPAERRKVEQMSAELIAQPPVPATACPRQECRDSRKGPFGRFRVVYPPPA